MNQQPAIQVGIMAAHEICFELHGAYTICNSPSPTAHIHFGAGNRPGVFQAALQGEGIVLSGEGGTKMTSRSFTFRPASPSGFFLLKDVTIGIDFHWEQKEDQRFTGDLKLIQEEGKVRAINIIPLEEYLRSVISSEMSATSSPELLKAHAVISRSWLLSQIEKSKRQKVRPQKRQNQENTDELIRWYDREDHQLFDVCADDHCQRYQGITKIISEKANRAIQSTFGEVLFADGGICDARFSKCCGGLTENFENVWEPIPHSYLNGIRDLGSTTKIPDLRAESEAGKWIRSSPPAFCNTSDQAVLSQVLPGFDQATSDFYRWKISYSQNELAALLLKKTGIDFGPIIRMEPVERGYSARLIRLKITGTKKTLVLGKELEIRRALSPSHLYSSAFVVDHLEERDGIPRRFMLTGAGWGHGVGLCQIGAAVMGEQGFSYREILSHYFKTAKLKKIYKQ